MEGCIVGQFMYAWPETSDIDTCKSRCIDENGCLSLMYEPIVNLCVLIAVTKEGAVDDYEEPCLSFDSSYQFTQRTPCPGML